MLIDEGMSTMIYRTILLVAIFALSFSCSDDEDPVRERKLPEFMKFTGEAEGTEGDLNVQCACDMNLEIPEFELDGNVQIFKGYLGGEIGRAITDDSGAGF